MSQESDTPSRRRPFATLGVAAVLLTLLCATGLVAWQVWDAIGGSGISGHGMIAMGLGVGAALLLGGGLITLLLVSHHRGFDDRVGRD